MSRIAIETFMEIQVTIAVDRLLFEIESYTRWVNKGQSWFANCGVSAKHTLCVDAKGRICRIGFDFQRAARDDAYPVRVYALARPYLSSSRAPLKT
jgi:hypothetical protein